MINNKHWIEKTVAHVAHSGFLLFAIIFIDHQIKLKIFHTFFINSIHCISIVSIVSVTSIKRILL